MNLGTNERVGTADMSAYEEMINIEAAVAERLSQQADRTRGEIMNCVHCSKRIPAARKKAIPGVDSCIECQEKVESGEL